MHIFSQYRYFIFLLPLAVLLSSCTQNHQTASTLHTVQQEVIVSNEQDEQDEQPDAELEDIEPLMCLDQELIELDKTGLWDKKSAVNNSQISNQENVIFDFPVVVNKQVEMYLNLFQNKQRKQFARWLARSGTYRQMMERELESRNLPKDLVYLAMIESGFSQMARSRANAVGLWQFMKATGRQYHLNVDRYVDERRDALKSTKAAATYLSDLYREFGDWHLAVAAYNGGPGKIRGGLKRYKVDNFWDLAGKKYLKLETKRYVPKLIATLLIAKEPEKYGFKNIQYQQPLEYDTLKVGPGMTLAAVARISNSTTKQIKALNRELRYDKTPVNRSRYQVNIPPNSATLAKANLNRLHSIVTTGYKTHKIRKGDTLTKICKRYGINKTTLLKVNNLHNSKLALGKNLRIPYSTITYQLLPKGSKNAMAAYKDSLVLHRIKKGETISKIAKRYRVPPQMIVAWNGLESVHSIRAGHQLALYINQGNSAGTKNRVRPAGNAIAQVIRADKKKIDVRNSSPSYQYYKVRNGDTLWTISRKFRISTADIKKWNKLKSNLIHPGAKLKLKKV